MADEAKRRTRSERHRTQRASVVQTPPPSTAEAFAAKAKDLGALRDSVVDAAGVGAGLWLSYLFFFFYLFVAVAAVTHRDLLLDYPIKLPFLGVELPLLGFFVLGPLLFLIVHAYVLLHFVMLAAKVGVFHSELEAQIGDEDVRTRLRRQLPSNIFVQFLAGPRESRSGVLGFMLRLIALVTLVISPVTLLVFFQLQFLPFHHAPIEWWQRIIVAADLVLLWMLWPSIARGETTWISWRDFQNRKFIALTLASLAPLLLVFTIATFPGEWLEESLPSVPLVPTKWPAWNSQDVRTAQPVEARPIAGADASENESEKEKGGKNGKPRSFLSAAKKRLLQVRNLVRSMGWNSLHDLLVAGDVDLIARKPTSLWSNRLVLPGIDVIDHAKFDTEAKLAAASETISLRGRRLEGAVLIGARLKKADLRGARLQGARLDDADLIEAKFDCVRSGWKVGGDKLDARVVPKEYCAQLQGASLNRAQLQGASLDFAELEGASLNSAEMQGTSLLQVALQGASLDGAQLQGVVFSGGGLHGVSLEHANLRGASLSHVDLQGASLDGAQLQGALLDHIRVWRTDPQLADAKGARTVAPELRPKYRWLDCPNQERKPCDWGVGSFAALRRLIQEQVPEGNLRKEALKRIAVLDPAKSIVPDDEKEVVEAWDALTNSSPLPNDYELSLAVVLRETGCAATGAPYVIRRLIQDLVNDRFAWDSPQRAILATAFLDEANCPGAIGLSEEDKAQLREMRGQILATPPSAAPTLNP